MSKYREKYIKHHGEPPEGWHIHHIDGDRKNNDIDNLIAVPPSLHEWIHDKYGSGGQIIKTWEIAEDGTKQNERLLLPTRKELEFEVTHHVALDRKRSL
jgi:hypothetical protein